MYFDIRTDLACELPEKKGEKIPGMTRSEEERKGGRLTRIVLHTEEAARVVGKPCGEYLTIDCGKLHLLPHRLQRETEQLLACELRTMSERVTERRIDGDFCVFVVGLGNASLTADAIGPATVARLTATRHLMAHDVGLYRSLECSALCALAPGVLGQTGIETQDIIKGAMHAACPDLVITVDALAARGCERLACTVQLSDSGIAPGSGVGNHRAELSRRTLGVPVIAIGVPTVVHSATLVYDALHRAGIEDIDERLREVLTEGEGFFVSPKESDLITEAFAGIVANAIGAVFTGGM